MIPHPAPSSESANPCLTCGACCATFRCSFYWAESDSHPEGTVPAELTEPLTPFRVAMKGMSGPRPRCIALEGEIGGCVSCSIYPLRSSVCRDFPYSGKDGIRNDRCEEARARHGLPPLIPDISPVPETPNSPDAPIPDLPVAA